jgi:uncharacterized protein (DUF488 family)
VPATREILTIGHSNHPIERFCELLEGAGVVVLADVRRHPGSRRYPQFNAGRLRESLAGIGVEHEPFGDQLGGRRVAGAPRGAAGLAAALAAYAEHARSDEYAAGIVRLEGLAAERRTVIMCAEGDWRHCHRQRIADDLAAREWKVLHLRRDGGVEEHPPAIPGTRP